MSARIPIAIIHPFDPLGSKIGGIEKHIEGFIRRAPAEFDLTVVGFTEDRKHRPVGKRTSLSLKGRSFTFFPVCYVPDPNLRGVVPQTLKFTANLFTKKLDYRGMILQFHRMEPTVFGPRNARKVLFIHGDMKVLYDSTSESKWTHFPSAYFALERILIRSMSRVFVQSDDGVMFYKRIYPTLRDRLGFFPSWVDETVFFPLSLSEKRKRKIAFLQDNGIDTSFRIILFAGRLERAKDPMLLMESFRLIHSVDQTAHLLVIGTGSFDVSMMKYADMNNLLGHVHFLGMRSQEDLANLMRISDVFLMTSSFEGMPYAVVEALASGLPVVSTNVGAISRVVSNKRSGLLVNSREPLDIGNAVLNLLKAPDLCPPEACVQAIQSFTAGNVLGDIYRFYYKLASSDESFERCGNN